MFFPTHFFAEHTSVHGLKYNRNVVDSILWLIPLGLALSICFYEANGTITKFLGFNQKLTVKTKNDTEEQGQSDFPAITFCPKTVFRRSMVGGVGLPLMLVGVNADWGNADEAIQLDKKDICSGDNWIDSYPGPHRVVLSMEIPTYKKGTGPMAKLYMMDSYQSAMDCKYQGITVNCSNLLYNTWSDSGWLENMHLNKT